MIRAAATVYFLLFSFTSSTHASLLNFNTLKPTPDCVNTVLHYITHSPEVKIVQMEPLKNAVHYNDEIHRSFKKIPMHDWESSIDKAIDHFGKYDKNFDGEQFKQWIHENPGTFKSRYDLGKYLHERYQPFKKIHPPKTLEDLEKTAEGLSGELKKIAQECGETKACHESKIKAWMDRQMEGSCLWKNQNALRALYTDLTLTNLGYVASAVVNRNDEEKKGFAWDLSLSNLFWTPFLAEMGCRNMIAKNEIGKKIEFNQPITRKAKVKTHFNNYVRYMAISPLVNTSFVAVHTAGQIITGKKKWEDVSISDLSKQVGSLVLWDALYPVPRRMIFNDPFNNRWMPAFGKYIWKSSVPPQLKNISYFGTDWGTRVLMSMGNTQLVEWWRDKADKNWGTHFNSHPKKSEDKSEDH